MNKFNYKKYRLENDKDPSSYNFNKNTSYILSKTAYAEVFVDKKENPDKSKNVEMAFYVSRDDKYHPSFPFYRTISTTSNDINNYDLNSIMENLMVLDYCVNNNNPIFSNEKAQTLFNRIYQNLDKLIDNKPVDLTPSEIVGEKIYDKAFNRCEKQSKKLKEYYSFEQSELGE